MMSALHNVGFPVPQPIHYCHSLDVIGTEFYLMEYVQVGILHLTVLCENSVLDMIHSSTCCFNLGSCLQRREPSRPDTRGEGCSVHCSYHNVVPTPFH